MKSGRELLVRVEDANPLIYDYKLVATASAPDPARAAFRTMFAVRDLTSAVNSAGASESVTIADASEKLKEVQTFALAVIALGRELLSITAESDWTSDEDAQAVKKHVDSRLEQAIRDPVGPYLYDERALMTRLDQLVAAVRDAERARIEPLLAAARSAAPGVINLYTELRTVALGVTWLTYKYDGRGEQDLKLAIANRLGDAYRPRRLAEGSIDVVALKAANPRFLFSVGMGALVGDRVAFTLDEVAPVDPPQEGQPAPPQQYAVRADTSRQLALLPSAILTMQFTLTKYPGFVFGPSLGIGVRADALEQIDTATDLSLMATIGVEWARISVGGAYTSEIVGLPGVGADNLTTDPNVLARASRDRRWRLIIAFHAAP